jgi:hypothetical protein
MALSVRSESPVSDLDKFLIQSVPLTEEESEHGMTSAAVSGWDMFHSFIGLS